MGCFTACFGSIKKYSKTNKPPSLTPPIYQDLCQTHEINEALLCTKQTTDEDQIRNPINVIADIKDKDDEIFNSSARKKVTFDLNVKTHEDSQVQEDTINHLVENDQKGKREDGKDEVRTFLCSNEKGEEKAKREQSKDEADLLSDSSVSSLFSYPPNLRYQNCTSSDDECVNMKFNNVSSDDEVDGSDKDKNGCEDFALEESSESLFSLSIDSKKQSFAVEIGEKEVSSPLKPSYEREVNKHNARNRSQYVHPVLNPIENLSQWKAVRANTTSPFKHQEKENIDMDQGFTVPFSEKENFELEQKNAISFSEEPNLKQSNQQRSKRFSNPLKDDEIGVDTSLSSWLMESEKTLVNENSPGSVGNSSSKRTKSPKSFEDRPILGVLTVEELKEMAKSSSPSPRRSPSHSPDEMAVIGSVGSYWRHTGAAMDADSGSSGKRTLSHCRNVLNVV